MQFFSVLDKLYFHIRNNFYFAENNTCTVENKNIRIIEYSLNKIIVKTSNNCDAKLMSSEVYYPGWKARVDGKEKPIIVSNRVFRTLLLPEGNHTIEYYYYPEIYIIGLIISFLTLSGAVFS